MQKVYETERVASAVTRVQVFARVYRKSDTEEFVARLYLDGKLRPECDAFESFNRYDRESVKAALESAEHTARDMVRRAAAS
jgi:hypothetical protein